MKRLLSVFGMLALAARMAGAQPMPVYINNIPLTTAPQVDALAFVNLSSMNFFTTSFPFTCADVLDWTNRGPISVDFGLTFDLEPSGVPPYNGPVRWSRVFDQQNPGTLSVGSTILVSGVFPKAIISATNINLSSSITVGPNGGIFLTGNNVNLDRSTLTLQGGFGAGGLVSTIGGACRPSGLLNPGIFDYWWGSGITTNAGVSFTAPGAVITAPHNVTNGLPILLEQFIVPNAQTFVNIMNVSVTNIVVQVVYLGAPLSGISTDVRFEPCNTNGTLPIINWQAVLAGGLTNDLFLSDSFGEATNRTLVTNLSTLPGGAATFAPINYRFSTALSTNFASLPPGNSVFTTGLLDSGLDMTNQYTGYAVTLFPTTVLPNPSVPGSSFINLPGRVEINASGPLSLNNTTIAGPNAVTITAPNFTGSSNVSVAAPFSAFNLGSATGRLGISNLVSSTTPFWDGMIYCWSARWTNDTDIVVAGTNGPVTNTLSTHYHVLMVDSSTLLPTAPSFVQDLLLRSSTNASGSDAAGQVFIGDTLNILSNFVVNADALTITSNGPAATAPYGSINLGSPTLFWSPNLPTLHYLTNWGLINLPSTAFFQLRNNPVAPSPGDAPYNALVNHGQMFSQGMTIWSRYFENSGPGLLDLTSPFPNAIISSGVGPVSITASNAVFNHGSVSAAGGDLAILSGSLSIRNTALLASAKLTLTASNSITDGGTIGNLWQVGDGVNAPVNPLNGDLLGTSLTSVAVGSQNVVHAWAGQDRGASPDGFLNNLALGRLVLDGTTTNTQFTISGPAGDTNKFALYVDQLELRDFATNRVNPNFTELNIQTNMTIYFADAVIGGADISEKLNGANGGRLVWVSNYNAGTFSSTNLLYPDGQIYSFNRALVTSLSVDSDGDGTVNRLDPTPILVPSTLLVSVTMVNSHALVSWNSPANAENYLYRSTNFTSAGWTLVTNFTQGHISGQVTVPDAGGSASPTYYRVRVVAH